jgi:hypothetical protein
MKFLLLFFITSCAQVTSLNMNKHEFGLIPTKIIWLQIAGLEEEQLAMLRFQHTGEKRTAFEEHVCIGKSWNYNLYNLRTSAQASFLAQLTGKKNIKESCEDAELRPIWSYLATNGYQTGIIETGASKKQSLLSFNACGEPGQNFLNSLYYWSRQEVPVGAATYNFRENFPLVKNQPLYDQTCQRAVCNSTLLENFKSIYQSFQKTSHKHLLVVRDFSYLEALEKKDLVKAKVILADLERTLAEALNLAQASSDYLVLVTSGDSRFVDMPDQGKQWFEFEKTGTAHINVKRTKLTNFLAASGARAENFCGMYEDAQIFERILSGPKQMGLQLKFINPFR